MQEDTGKLILRLVLGLLVLLHGIAKLSGSFGMLADTVTKAGLPVLIAYGVYIGEVIAPLMLIVGWYSRIGAILIGVNMLFAIGLVHMPELPKLGESGGWALELQGMFLFTAVALALIGPGRYALNSK